MSWRWLGDNWRWHGGQFWSGRCWRIIFGEKFLGDFYNIFERNLRLHQVAVGAQTVGALLVVALAKGSQHDDFDVLEAVGVTEDVEHLKAADFGHHDIRNDQVGGLIFGDY